MWIAVGFLVVSFSLMGQPLQIVEGAVSETIDGGAVPETYEFSPGDIVHLSFQVSGFQRSERGEIQLAYVIEAVDCLGYSFELPHGEQVARPMPQSRNVTRPIRFSMVLPNSPWPGDARFRVSLTDVLAGETVRTEFPFAVAGIPPDLSSGFRVAGFGVFSSEAAQQRLVSPVFRAGDTVWSRFSLAGFSRGERNRFSLGYSITLVNAGGRVVLSVPQAASQNEESYYPRWEVPGLINLHLETSIKSGIYTLIIEAVDEIGKSRARAEVPLRVL